MKIWPIVTLIGLLYGGMYADGMGTKRESKPHRLTHRGNLDADLAEDMKAFDMPHRVASIAYVSFFKQMMNEQTDWGVPEGKHEVTADDVDPDDGQDPGKKLFWTTVFPKNNGVPFTGWGDPNPTPNPDNVAPDPCTSCRPLLSQIVIVSNDPGPPKPDDNVAVDINTTSQLPFGELKTFDNIVASTDPSSGVTTVTLVPCETVLVNGVCTLPCKGDDDPLCKDTKDPLPPGLTDPLGSKPPITVGGSDPPPFLGGGGSGSGPVGGIGSGGGVGGVPEPSTWVMLILGLGIMSLIGWRRAATIAS